MASGGGAVREVGSRAELDAAVGGARAAAVHFWAAWCEASKQMDEVFAHLAVDFPHALFLRVEAEEQPEISEAYGVTAVPYFVFCKEGKPVDTLEGANPASLANKVAKLAGPANVAQSAAPASLGVAAGPAVLEKIQEMARQNGSSAAESTLKKRLEQLVNSHPVILFMKGNPEEPRCGFSRRVVDILKQEGVEFGSFDILSDNEVREGLKKFSNWPTFPQLYCKGELLGGCDIVIARHESGELKDVLKEHNIPLRPQGSKIEKPVTSESANEKSHETIGLTAAQKARLENLTNSNPVMIFIKVHPRSPSVDSVGRSFIFLRKKIISATSHWTNSKVSKLTAFCAQGRTTVCHHVSKPLLDVKHLFPSICRLIDITRPWDPGTSWFRLSSLIWNSDLIETASRPALSASHCLRASNVLWGR